VQKKVADPKDDKKDKKKEVQIKKELLNIINGLQTKIEKNVLKLLVY